MVGIVKWFDCKKGYGFIEREVIEPDTDIFVHFSDISKIQDGRKILLANQVVMFDASACKKGQKAVNVTVLDIWNNRNILPEVYKEIIVIDKYGKTHNSHRWVGHAYYEFIKDEEMGVSDGYRSDWEIVGWKYAKIEGRK